MAQEEKQILLKDLCARLPYGIICNVAKIDNPWIGNVTLDTKWLGRVTSCFYEIKPYLRPLSSMTEEERGELRKILCLNFAPKDCPQFEPDFSVRTFYSCNEQEQDEYYDMETMLSYFKFLNSHHFDYRGLIGMGLALEAPEGMYNFK